MSIAELGTGRYGQLLTRLLGIPGQPPITEVGSQLEVGLTLENDRPEWGYLKGEYSYMGSAVCLPVAAQRSIVRFRNPASSGVLAVLSWFQLYAAAIGQFSIFQAASDQPSVGDLAPASQGGSMDLRVPSAQLSSCRVSSLANTPSIAGNSYLTVQVTTALSLQPFVPPRAYILPPNSVLDVAFGTDFVGTVVGFHWTERPIVAPYEL